MDAGAVLNALLARHNSYVNSTNEKCALQRERRGQDAATTSARPPSKVMEAVSRGVNPLMLGADLHKTESAARERAKRRRTESASSRRAGAPRGRRLEERQRNTEEKGSALTEERSAVPSLPTSRKANLARAGAVSKTLAAQHQRLHALQQCGEEPRSHVRLSSSTADASQKRASAVTGAGGSGSEGDDAKHAREKTNLPMRGPTSHLNRDDAKTAVSAKTRRDIWRRRCTTRKILRLSRGVSRATALRRYRYTTLDAVTAHPSSLRAAAAAKAQVQGDSNADDSVPQTITFSRQLVQDTVEAKCAARRRSAARRIVLANYHAGLRASTKAATATTADGQRDGGAVSAPKMRLTRRQHKAGINGHLQQADTEMWSLVIRVVAERHEMVKQLTSSCAAAAAERGPGKDGVLPLLLARHFPLFGAVVEVQVLELQVPCVNRRRSRHRRRARYAAHIDARSNSIIGAAASCTSRLCVLQRNRGIVVEEYSDTIGVLLLPSSDEGQLAWAAAALQGCALRSGAIAPSECTTALQKLQALVPSPHVVRVPKHFPGASGAFTELLPLMLAATRHRSSLKAEDACFPAASSAGRSAHMRVLAAVFCGELSHFADVVVGATSIEAHNTGALTPSAISKYPLERLQHRCL
ncbi:hypothetical protein ABL78_3106 [Leptomonas seymouri]|uniref:Uncharacterized protein n=1 Tax=Leptomonas seymouri TaxID=5684 RepID=A0A0N0P714_LEPSE|nr:hypothetical protein ABL78_3106 [Leptomonas seymouri]|eukprot:KPI87807.1 hypothetical protein ABL78_3106 [Leptomonas seymouri]